MLEPGSNQRIRFPDASSSREINFDINTPFFAMMENSILGITRFKGVEAESF
ncbi:hypothetical protein [Escherichia coli]|uniref:hypothetical protein n=1 Tax=Escherichia coli TaxID=562 RepID=UPI002282566A|nr:hypothetical protein [Escherichia coli]MCZ0371272.1 hypothetical protein [Escherichia coli]